MLKFDQFETAWEVGRNETDAQDMINLLMLILIVQLILILNTRNPLKINETMGIN